MNQPSASATCPQCHAALPADAPQGLCPACLLAAVAEPTEAGTAPLLKTPPPTREQVAAAFPQLEIIGLIGTGGMGYVFKARQPKLDRLVALKLLPQHLGADAAFAGRFEREGRLLARLSHPNIVAVHDFGFVPSPQTPDPKPQTQPPGFFYLLMEFVDGVNLRQAMRAGRFTPVQALEVVPKICEALQFAHEQGILHRDIKPENILLDARGRVKLVDFGIAKLVGPDAVGRDSVEPSNERSEASVASISRDSAPSEEARFTRASSVGKWGSTESHPTSHDAPPHSPFPIPQPLPTLTSATVALGTPSYMAPEQRDRPAEVDHRADIYSLGVVFYELLTGELPVGQFAPPSAKSASDPRVDEVVLRALEQQRERRQQSAGEVRTQVENISATARSRRVQEAESSAAHANASPGISFFATLLSALVVTGLIALVVLNFRRTQLHTVPTSNTATNAPAAATPPKPVPDLSPKQITFHQITNNNGHAFLSSQTQLAPGESFQGWLVLPDGSREQALSSESGSFRNGQERNACIWSWILPSPFGTNHTDEVVTQLRARWAGKLLAFQPGQPITLFTLTNESGVTVSGQALFNRTMVDPAKPAVAEIKLRSQSTSLMLFTSRVPDGYALRIRPTGTEVHAAHPNLWRSSSKLSEDSHASWSWTDGEYGHTQSTAVAGQIRALFAQGPLLITNGQPRTVFSVTNANGKVYSGQFELRGPTDAK